MADTVLVDGVFCTAVPADDRGLAYGDGVFRTLRVEAGRPRAWTIHMQRLAHDCASLSLPRPDIDRLAEDVRQLFADDSSGVLKIMITRGSGGRGYAPQTSGGRRIVSAHPLPAHANQDALALDASPVALATQRRLAGIKHLNRLEQVLARDACLRAGCEDAFMCDGDGWVIATTMRNLLFRDQRGQWLTPSLTRAGIIGATRQALMAALERTGTPVHETEIAVGSLGAMIAAIACNSVAGVVAVERMGETRFADSAVTAQYCRGLLE